jgi:hypothetical protein
VAPAERVPKLIGVAKRWRQRHPFPRPHDEHSGQDKGTEQEQGRASEAVRALCMPYVRDTHGLPRLITVSRNRCSTAVSCACHVVPKLSTRGSIPVTRSTMKAHFKGYFCKLELHY